MAEPQRSRRYLVQGLAGLVVAAIGYKLFVQQKEKGYRYPKTRRGEVVDDYHGTKVSDPYRWLEDPDSKETQEWVSKQAQITASYLSQCDGRGLVKEKLTSMLNFERYSCPFKRGENYYFFKNDGLQNHYVLFQQTSLDAKETVFLDPNKLSDDGTAALGSTSFSESGKYFAYCVSQSGSDWSTCYIKNAVTKEDFKDKVSWVRYSGISWTHDDVGFFYSRYPVPKSLQKDGKSQGSETDESKRHMIYYHVKGTDQSEDIFVFTVDDQPDWFNHAHVTDDGKYIMIVTYMSCEPVNRVYYIPIQEFNNALAEKRKPKITKLIDNFDAEYDYITNTGSKFWFKTNLLAPRHKIIQIDLEHPERENWRTIIPQSTNVLNYVVPVNESMLLVTYMIDAKDILQLFDNEGNLLVKEFPFPSVGTVSGLTARREDSEFFFAFSSFLYPGTMYHVNLNKFQRSDKPLEPNELKDFVKVFREVKVPGLVPSDYKAEQVFYKSKDGTKIPMFIVSSKELKYDGQNPTYLYGYGGFNIAIQPDFRASRIIWMKHFGGVYCIPNIRGGGEYGEEWYKAGILKKKQNVFDDFIAAAEYLVEKKITSPKKLAIVGGSNGGLLVAACANQRPDLFGCVIPEVGVLDMLRFHKFTVGAAWASDYGRSDVKDQFEALYKYSPLHNIPVGKPYPSIMLTTADHDDRVSPLHSYKFISELQHKLGDQPYQKSPLLIRIERKAGHGAGKPLAKIIEEQADVYSFIAKSLGIRFIP